jgi:L-threonylcarbamoyladenylate synthase
MGNPAPSELTEHAAELLSSGHVVLGPSDTHYTLMAHPHRSQGTSLIYKIKERDTDFPLTVFVEHPSLLDKVAMVDDAVRALVAQVWPGFLTIIVPKRSEAVPDHVTAGLPTVAIACHRHPLLGDVLRRIGGYAACTSANLSGHGEGLITFGEACQQVGDRVSLALDGGTPAGSTGNTIVDLTGPEPVLVRAGEVPVHQVRQFLPDLVISTAYKTS